MQPVSVIICARNEAANLERFLPQVLRQDYPAGLFEVIVVDDGSTDTSAAVLAALQQQYGHLRIITIPADTQKDLPGKKYALRAGIAAAQYERLLLTDADCQPASATWLRDMTAPEAAIVLGYGAYQTAPGLLNRFIRWETVHTCMQYAGYGRRGKAYMGVGRNLCYNKSLLAPLQQDAAFQETYRHTPSGDDDLLIAAIATHSRPALSLQPAAHTISLPQPGWRSWWHQKTRHVSTGKFYPAGVKRLLGVYGLSHGLFWLIGLLLLVLSLCMPPGAPFSFWRLDGCLATPDPFIIAVWIAFLLRIVLYWINAAVWYRGLAEKKLFLFYPIGDLGWALYNVILSPYILWKSKQAWK
ncbi:glycosyltransferase [Taibaiella koreensis]|uniref:glycosyltransferase n=1 Tax=Taibaiella koreensis TaxID=1268548 RepID=UPI0013C2D31D|nr:glycosyltransferase [Taibaiella koreensis]